MDSGMLGIVMDAWIQLTALTAEEATVRDKGWG
jgi:hypothetical protein